MPQYEQTLDRLVAYMKYSGQNLLSYPAVWYHGRIGPAYQPRSHDDDYIGCILAKFAPQGLGFMPAINLQNIELPDGRDDQREERGRRFAPPLARDDPRQRQAQSRRLARNPAQLQPPASGRAGVCGSAG